MPSPISNPLLAWSVVAAVCALALAMEARLLFGLWRRAPRQRALRWFTLGFLAGSMAGIVVVTALGWTCVLPTLAPLVTGTVVLVRTARRA